MKSGKDPLTLAALQKRFCDPAACLAFLEKARWPDGPVCPGCGVVNHASRIIILAILDRLDILEEVTTAARAMREATEEYIRMCEDDEMDAEKYKQAQTVEYKATRALDDALDRLKE